MCNVEDFTPVVHLLCVIAELQIRLCVNGLNLELSALYQAAFSWYSTEIGCIYEGL